ncbi:MAG: CAP domain-containing protein [Ilumatobacteraceae bacterium]
MRHTASTCVALVALLVALLSCGSSPKSAVANDIGTPPFIPASAGWLQSVNYFRSIAGLGPVTEDPNLDAAATAHACYMVLNDITHEEDPAKPGYTTAGAEAGSHSNVAVSSRIDASDRSFVELWMTGPYHAVGVLRPGLHSVGFGRCDRTDTPKWRSGATLNVLDGLGEAYVPPAQPILFPGNGTTTNLNRFLVESPDPLEACQWTGGAGLPVLAMMPESTVGATGTITGSDGPLETCVVSAANTTGVANQILAGDHVVVVIPRAPLRDGRYEVTVHTDARDVTWSFTVDQTAADGPS